MIIDAITPSVKTQLQEFEGSFADMLRSQVPLADKVVQYISKLKGKRLRPALVFLTGQLHGVLNEKSMDAAIVVELLHTATLVHDDVVDNSALRRGHPTVNSVWDNRISILVGDLLFSRTLTAVLNLKSQEALSILSETANRITEGELLQVEHARDYRIEEPVYYDLVAKKTAALFSACCELGALAADASAEHREQMKKFGECLGIAFQIKDDLLDYAGDVNLLGKPVGNDIRENKVTLPLIYTLAHSDEDKRNEIIRVLEQDETSEDNIRNIVQHVQEMGGLAYAEKVARSYADQAFAILHSYPESQAQASLITLVHFAISREN